MNIENMQLKGQLAEAKKKYKQMETEASGLIILTRSLLNPYEEDITKLDMEKVSVSVQRLKDIAGQMSQLKTKIEKLEAHFD